MLCIICGAYQRVLLGHSETHLSTALRRELYYQLLGFWGFFNQLNFFSVSTRYLFPIMVFQVQ